jgi:hypothetical protein
MTRSLLATLVAVFTIACGQDPAKSVKIPRSTLASGTATALTASAVSSRPALHWNAAMCPPVPGASGPSAFAGTGACAFEQHEGATCVMTDDDLLMKVLRPAPDNGQFLIFVTVENNGSTVGRDRAEVVVGVENAQGLFRWATGWVRAKASDEKSVTLDETHLTAMPPLKEQDVVVSGRLTCASTVTARDAR